MALMSALFVRTYFAADAWVRGGHVSPRLLPWLGGALVGLLVFATAGALAGDGHAAAPLDLFGRLPWWILLALAAGKILATSLTLNLGGSGGVFTPALFVGAASGGAFGAAAAQLFPGLGIDPALYSLAGMGALVAGATGAPITGILLVFEMTNDFALVLPLMVAVVACKTVMLRFERDSLYSGWLRRRGETVHRGDARELLDHATVGQILDRDPLSVREDSSIAEVIALLGQREQSVLPVVDGEGRCVGLLTASVLGEALRDAPGLAQSLIAADLARPCDVLMPDDSLAYAMGRIGKSGNEAVPVVHPDTGRLVGLLSRGQLLATYHEMLGTHHDTGEHRRAMATPI
jgi:chloride channel protein, CIC family